MFDPWIIGTAPESGRSYVVHAVAPRFIVEVIELGDQQWKAGALVWIDDPGERNAERWSREAGQMYFRSVRAAHEQTERS